MNTVISALIGIGILFAVVRLIKGPSYFDRVLSVDVINIIITGIIVFLAYLMNNSIYLDIAIVYSILSFLETIIFARYLEGRR
jgi:multicomponent Na+:H+ antiporter subunit F